MKPQDRGPRELESLLWAASEEERDRAWARFVDRHSRLLLKVAHENGRRHDDAMDRYAFILEGLRGDGLRRLRRYRPDGRTKFTTWLVVVARRLCVDHHRHLYGRPRRDDDKAAAEHEVRRRLVDFVMEEIDPERSANHRGNGADGAVRREQLIRSLHDALDALPDDERLTLRLRFEDDVPVSDIARVLGLPTVFHVYRRLQRTLARLREDLERRGVEGPTP